MVGADDTACQHHQVLHRRVPGPDATPLALLSAERIHEQRALQVLERLLLGPQRNQQIGRDVCAEAPEQRMHERIRSEEHTSELQSLMRISYAVFCLKKKKIKSRKLNPTIIQ